MISHEFDLKPFNTFGLTAKAAHFATFSTTEELSAILQQLPNEKLLVLGGGSNILFTEDYNGLVIKNEIKGFEILEENAQRAVVKAGAGEEWNEFVISCIRKGFAGVENLSLIPGSVGASPMQNIGAYGVEIKDVFQELEAYHIETGEIHTFDAAACEFGYRESVFKGKLKGQYIILTVTFLLKKNPNLNTSYGAIEFELKKMGVSKPTIKDISKAVIAIRNSKLPNPKIIGNAGSFFKNPVVSEETVAEIKKTFPDIPNFPAENGMRKLPAGWLIEQAGWKGKTYNQYGVHKFQSLVLVNYGGATGTEIFRLSSRIIKDLEEKFGVTLEREVNII